MDDTVRLILRWLIVPVLFLVFLYALAVAGMVAANLAQPQQDYMQVAVRLKDDLGVAAFEVWRFVRPLLQLGIVLLLLHAFLRTIGVDLGLKATVTQEASIQTVLAFVVVGGFALAALVSENPASWLKDLALVVVGFYFGTRAKDWDDRKGELGPDLTPPKPQAGGKSSTQPEVPHNQTAVGPDLGPRMDPSTLPTYQEFKQSLMAMHPIVEAETMRLIFVACVWFRRRSWLDMLDVSVSGIDPLQTSSALAKP